MAKNPEVLTTPKQERSDVVAAAAASVAMFERSFIPTDLGDTIAQTTIAGEEVDK